MTEQEMAKQSADLLRRIIRSVDKKIEYTFIDSNHQGRFLIQILIRGRIGTVSLRSVDLRSALVDNVRRNAIRQRLKNTRDHLLSNYVDDVMGRKMARMLVLNARGQDDAKASFFYRRPQPRR